ncbi:MAG: ABC transporter permease subunit [Actinomycetota bacterium]
MLRNVFVKTLRDERRAFLWWSIGLVALSMWITLIYPTYSKGAADFNKFFEQAPKAFRAMFGEGLDFGTAAGFLKVEVFSLMAPLLVIIFAVGLGSAAIAGEEKRGTAELLVSLPISRTRIALDKFAGLAVSTGLVTVVIGASLIVGVEIMRLDVSIPNLVAATFLCGLMGLMFGALAFALSALTGSRGLSVGVVVALVVAMYFLNVIAGTISSLHSIRWLSPFYVFTQGNPLTDGVNVVAVGAFLVIAVVCGSVAILGFRRRDLRI